MASSGGLTRRRGAGGAGPANTTEDEDTSRVSSPKPKEQDSRAPETSYVGGENGHKIAFDPKDIGESEERSKQPKLTLMEEVLLMGLKDKQVWFLWELVLQAVIDKIPLGLSLFLERQYFLCLARLYSHRVGIQRSDQHAKRLVETAVSSFR